MTVSEMAQEITPTRLRLGLILPIRDNPLSGITEGELDALLSGIEDEARQDRPDGKGNKANIERLD
jgi:hypothetical protein